ncbi:MAG: hypothetical protein DRN66_01690 [Candidatus Nanohalarchaeota archaeon]|nr:MAG: hypothetical protein DRN66_01690 [Candidatus Nanohaloarchaeota archaeon]
MEVNRKAVTPVIAVVLLLMMTVAVGGVAFMWITKMQKGMQDDITEQQEAMTKKASASLVIDSAWSTAAAAQTHILIRNNGQYTFTSSEIDNMQVFLDGVPIGALSTVFDDATVSNPCIGNALAPGESCEAVDDAIGNVDWTGGSGWEFRIELIEAETEARASKSCRMSSDSQLAC